MHMRDFPLKTHEWQRGRDSSHSGEGDWIEYPETKRSIIERFDKLVTSCVLFEANTYRSIRNIAWKTQVGAVGCQTLFDDDTRILEPYAQQQCAMEPKSKMLLGSEYSEWAIPKRVLYDKEFFDTNTGSFMLASYCGLNLDYGEGELPDKGEQSQVISWLDRIKKNKSDTEIVQDTMNISKRRRGWN
jgi:hypothetical protein